MESKRCSVCNKIIIDKKRSKYCSSECYAKKISAYHKKRYQEKPIYEARLKLRFEILKRDNFTCQYCGRKAPVVELQIEYILVSKITNS